VPAIAVIKLRRGTAAQWVSVNPILASGERGLETDTQRTKTGNASSAWNDLLYDDDLHISPEFTYVDGVLTTITYADGSVKTLTYSGGKVTRVDHDLGAYTIRKDLVYNGSDNLISITQVII